MARPSTCAVVALSSVICALADLPAVADEVVFNCTVTTQTSTVTQTIDLTAPFAGTLIGNYDAVNNPTGTRTLPGVFGGTGNNAIPYTASFVLAGDIVSHPIGSLVLGVDSEGLQIRVSNLSVDLLGGVPGTLGATVNILYQTFRTVAPSSFYPGGVTVPVPVGNGTITTFTAVQTGDGVFGVLVPQKDGSFQFNVAVPVNYTVVATALGQPVGDGAPTPGVLPLTGRLVEGSTTVTLALDTSTSQNTTQPVEADPFTDVPLALPTVFPTGGTANLLLTGDVTSFTLATTLNASLDATGARQPVPGDVNGDYVVNAADLSLLLAAWGTPGPGDFDGDGVVGASDLSVLLLNWR
ncbi:MAG: hypothetical protein ACKO3W_14900 [bacterium]